MRKRWNVMVVPDSPGSRVFSFNLTSSSLRVAVISAACFVVVTAAILVYAAFGWQNQKQERISSLEAELEDRETEVSKLREEFSILEQLEDKLRTMAGLKPRPQSDSEGPSGGPEVSGWEIIAGGPSSESVSRKSVENLTPRELLANSIELKSSLEEILDVFDREKDRLSRIPSINPVSSQEAWISSGFGYRKDPISGTRRFHDGCDIVAPRKTPVIAPADAVVKYAGWREGLGRTLELEHGYGYKTIYGHNHKLFVKKGDRIKRGDLIAHVGSSGRSTGPHLHYEVRLNGKLVNPYKYVTQ
jgi:murein DD-endopeptidase MepM/ murein hydrolase activator NlpD